MQLQGKLAAAAQRLDAALEVWKTPDSGGAEQGALQQAVVTVEELRLIQSSSGIVRRRWRRPDSGAPLAASWLLSWRPVSRHNTRCQQTWSRQALPSPWQH